MKHGGEEVVTHDGPDRQYRMCLCSECGEVQRCVPANDFYAREGAPVGAPLVCSGCFRKPMEAKGIRMDPLV